LGISQPRASLSPRLNTFDSKLLVGNYAFLIRSCICPVFKYNERECRHCTEEYAVNAWSQREHCNIRSASSRSQCFLLRRGWGVLTVLDDRYCDIQSITGKNVWRMMNCSRSSLWICWTFKCARVNLIELWLEWIFPFGLNRFLTTIRNAQGALKIHVNSTCAQSLYHTSREGLRHVAIMRSDWRGWYYFST
jgi:hypothetical protein